MQRLTKSFQVSDRHVGYKLNKSENATPFCEKNYYCSAKMDFIFNWAPYISY